jgi:uncharacterized protein YjbJ (UPF0337 family)
MLADCDRQLGRPICRGTEFLAALLTTPSSHLSGWLGKWPEGPVVIGRGTTTRSRRSDGCHTRWQGELAMDKDRVQGAAHEAKGAVKEAAGKLTGDAKTQAEGKAEKAAGKVQNAAGGAKDAARDALNKG